MEEWIGRQWHRLVTQAASREHAAAAVTLDEVQRTLALLFRAGGGDSAVRLAPVGERAVGGPRDWLQRLAGSGQRAALGQLSEQVLALPPRLAVFAERSLNRDLYIWLAALAAHDAPSGDWLVGQTRASAAALQQWPGLRQRHARLLAAHLAQRPAPGTLRGDAARAERLVQQTLRGQPVPLDTGIGPADVAPVWLWLEAGAAPAAAASGRRDPSGDTPAALDTVSDRTRRRAERVAHDTPRAPLMMFFRAESILSWGEFVRVNRATDDDDHPDALQAANDMERLAIAPDGQRSASRVRFDLDLPSAAVDDQPLGAPERLPEWDWKRQRLLTDHCAVQRVVAPAPAAFVPTPELRRTARQVRRRLELLRAAPERQRGEAEGDEIDLDAWVRHRIDAATGAVSGEPRVFQRARRSGRSLATLLLADLSLSTDAHVWLGGGDKQRSARVIDVIRDALYVFGEALQASGDAFEMLGFSSVRRQQVRIQHLKGFDERWAAPAQARVGAIKPGYYTRMGAAIRHASARLAARPERQRLLLLLTDGKPNDLDHYEGRWGLEDTRHAVHEARALGLTPFAVTIDEQAHDYLPMLFGEHGWALVHRPQELVQRLAAVQARLAGT
ncbi:VWA domain-containing protein [Ideonella sp. 4Y16]|uniref:VWA domain-containing protein n=1 Tax=Ideonella alba TaxID=2824118 RepID=A0A941BJ73_9BURK|nr:VWA domain-containing protein [Ideonella alba]MBQ0933513.1 VWA domain-containing protein [Ideonella alba]MBQ0946509.1 VWA domain-containing protein [Ideonella alba]